MESDLPNFDLPSDYIVGEGYGINLLKRYKNFPCRVKAGFFKRIKEWGRNLNLEDTILALNIIDQFVEQNNDNYSTRIEIRIADTK